MMLASIYFSLFFCIFFSLFLSDIKKNFSKLLVLAVTGFVLIQSSLLFVLFNSNQSNFQFLTRFFCLDVAYLNIDFSFGLDGISIYFFFLTAFLSFLCLIFIWEEPNFKFYSLLLLSLELLLLLTFSVLNLLLFYLFFECILIPIYLIIGVWGSREKKIRASYLLFFYTVCCSLLMLVAIVYIYSLTGTFNLEYLEAYNFSFEEQIFLWFAFFLSFASKIPLFPFHIWLPEAHVEAPTVGSVLLAGVLLKLGIYGFLRYSLPLFPQASVYFSPLVFTLGVAGVILASLTAIKQTDLKKIIAYSSIAHMNLVVLGLFSGNILGLEASILQSVSHGFVSSALFFLIGILYARYHSRLLFYYGGLVQVMPIYSSFFLFFTLSNIALPGTSSFVGEFLILIAIFQENTFCSILAGFSVVLSGAYSLWLYNRVSFGNIKTDFLSIYSDLNFREFFILFLLAVISLYLGLLPYQFLTIVHLSSVKLFIISNAIFI
jgi:proton-translocating NADH-quinone oxidoreductase chain M